MPGQRLGQHGNGAARKVDADPARLGLVVKCRALAQVVGNVGDRDPQALPTGRQRLERDSVVEVARRLGVDGGERDVAQIRAVVEIGGYDRRGCALELADDRGGEFVGDVGAGQGLLHLGARIVGIAQNLEQSHLDRRARALGEARDLGDHRLARSRADPAAHHYGRADARVVGLEAQERPAARELPGNLAAAPFQHPQHAAFEPAPANPPLDLDLVAVHGRAAVARADVDVLGMVVGHHEAEAVGMDLDPARVDARRGAAVAFHHDGPGAYTLGPGCAAPALLRA